MSASPDIFLSCNREDAKVARQLANVLIPTAKAPRR